MVLCLFSMDKCFFFVLFLYFPLFFLRYLQHYSHIFLYAICFLMTFFHKIILLLTLRESFAAHYAAAPHFSGKYPHSSSRCFCRKTPGTGTRTPAVPARSRR